MSDFEVKTIRPKDPAYPSLLAEIAWPPKLLYATGLPLGQAPYLAVVGSRRPSRYGIEVATWISSELAAAGIVVVSGMARGIDAAAHRGALQTRGSTVAVLGSGIDVCYPRQNRDLYREIQRRGTVVSEYQMGTRALPQNFPARNRIIAGMCLGVVIVEGRVGGGAMITARLAAESGREVFAVAGPVHSAQSEGPHSLIRDGARLVTCAADVLDDLGLGPPPGSSGPEVAVELTADERRVLGVLEGTPVLLDVVAARTRMPASGAAATLARLEVKGLVLRHPGARFALSPRGGSPALSAVPGSPAPGSHPKLL